MTGEAMPQGSLADIELLMEAPPEVLDFFTSRCDWRRYQEGDVILDRDDRSTDVYFIVKGKVRILDFANEMEVPLGEKGEGRTFGEMSAIDAKKRSARVVALEKTEVAMLSRKDFRQLLMQVPGICLMLLKRYAGIIRRLNQRITTVSTQTSQQRVYMELLRMSSPNPSGDGSWVIERLPNHHEIASMTSTAVQDVAAAIGELARAGLVARKHKTLLLKYHGRLTELANL
ncbi:MAG: Crp/Fnr family transcriptional regulator [Alphaproteobacteria bacterium]|nr:Crp/Fnr family transcriptional regulator [Alphaproteobacteria bacterium]